MSIANELLNDTADFMMSDFTDVAGLDHPVAEREDAGFRVLSLLADDLDLDAAEIDLGCSWD